MSPSTPFENLSGPGKALKAEPPSGGAFGERKAGECFSAFLVNFLSCLC